MEKSTAGDQNFHILDQMRQWVKTAADKNHENDIVQFKKGTQRQLTYSTKNGRIRKFIARIINFFSKKDYFDEKKIGNSKRQKQVADLFRQQIRDALKDTPNYGFNDHRDKLTRSYVVGELTKAGLLENNFPPQLVPEIKTEDILRAQNWRRDDSPVDDQFYADNMQMRNELPQNANLGVFGNSAFDKEIIANFDFQTDLQTLAGINFDDLIFNQVDALRQVYENWQASIEGAEGIPEDNRGHILGNLISNSTPLLRGIIRHPGLADQYLSQSQQMANKLRDFVTRNVQGNTTFEQTSQDAFDLMSEFAKFARIYGNLTQQTEERPSFGDCILFPVLQVATELGVDEGFQGNLTVENVHVFNSLFQNADNFAAAKGRNELYCGEFISIENFNDKSFDLAISFEPIRCLFNLVADPNVMNQYQDFKVRAVADEKNFAIKANEFVNQHSHRKSHLQWQARTLNISQNIENDLFLQESFKVSIGISWGDLTQNQKINVKNILDSICQDAALTGKDVGRHLEDMKPLIVKIMHDRSFYQQYFDTMYTVRDSMSRICLNAGNPENEFERVTDEYFERIARPLLELNNKLEKKINLDALSLYAVNTAVNHCFQNNQEVALKFATEISNFSALQQLALATQVMQRHQYNQPVAAEIDVIARDQVLDTGPLCQFALQMNKLAPKYSRSPVIEMSENAKWLKPGAMAVEEYDEMSMTSSSDLILLENKSSYIRRCFDANCRKIPVPANENVINRANLQLQPENAGNQIGNQIQPRREPAPNLNIVQGEIFPNVTAQAAQAVHLNLMTNRHFENILNYLGQNPLKINQEQRAAVAQFAYLFIDEDNAVTEEAVEGNSQFLNALLAAPRLSASLQSSIDQLGNNISKLAVAKNERDFADQLARCAFNLNMIKSNCEIGDISEDPNATGQLDFGMLISGITSVIAANQPGLFENLANNIDNTPELQSVLAAMIDLRFDAQNQEIENYDLVTSYASAPSFLPIISKAYMHRDGDANGLGVKILNSNSKGEIRDSYDIDQLEQKFNETKQRLSEVMNNAYNDIELYKADITERKKQNLQFQL